MATHSSTLAWRILWAEEPGRLQSMGLRRVGHDWATSFSLSLSCTGEGNGNPLQSSCLENPRDRGAWWVAVYGVAQSRTRLKWLSSSRSNIRMQMLSHSNSSSWHISLKIFLHVCSWRYMKTVHSIVVCKTSVVHLYSSIHCTSLIHRMKFQTLKQIFSIKNWT